MRALLDVNVLIALLDVDHLSHHAAGVWMANYAENGWASCPITQNGCIRIMSGGGYLNPLPVSAVVERLRSAVKHPLHEFWPDHITLLDPNHVDAARVHGPRQLTDSYLLALAVAHGGCFVTFNRRVSVSAIPRARPANLIIL